jgi:5S rRNA maturation endonuclease (ribonuclease M5)
LSDRKKDRYEKIQQVITKLTEASSKGKPIVVEGKKDEAALRTLGVGGAVLTVKTGGKSFLEAAAEIEALGVREAVLLLDFDRRGKEGTRRLQQNLERVKIKVNIRFWIELEALVGREVQCIESLPSYLDNVAQKVA